MQQRIVGKTVYTLGAGASLHTGAPMLGDFLKRAQLIRDGAENLVYGEQFNRVFQWIDQLRAASYYVDIDLANLEHVFSIAEMAVQAKLPDADRFSDLRYLILETLDFCTLEYNRDSNEIRPSKKYVAFVQELLERNAERRELALKFVHDSIITFNYDVMLEYALFTKALKADYCLDGTSVPESLKLLKLHGSTNWAICKKCQNPIPQLITPQLRRPGEPKDHHGRGPGHASFFISGGLSGISFRCHGRGASQPLDVIRRNRTHTP